MERLRPTPTDTDLLELGNRKHVHPQRVAVSRRGVIATAHHLATNAGVEMFNAGGNAFDAAVAAAFALGVCEPAASGLGGQTMLLLRDADSGQTIALDGSSRAPNRATPDLLTRRQRRHGHTATTVPSTPAVLRYTLERFGKLKLKRVLEPAIRLADDGFDVSVLHYALTRRELKKLRGGTAAPLFLRDGTKPYPVGSRFRQPALAETLRRLAKRGVKDFYTGQIARQIHDDMARNGGLIQRDDLAQVPRPIERRPIACRFAHQRLFTFPPPGAGRTLIEMLNIYQRLPERLKDFDTPRGAVSLAQTIRRAFLDRQDRPFDPNYFPQVEKERMLSDEYTQLVAKQIAKRIRTHGETTHLSAMDADGNVVGLTQSIERVYGSCAASPELGFLYNNYMTAFEYEDIAHPYYLRPNAVPWASVAPTIVFRGRKPWAVLGSPGSDRITSSVFQVLVQLQAANPFAAVEAPRMHCSLAGKVSLEATRMRSDIIKALERNGFEIDVRDPYSFYLGCVQLVTRDGDALVGVADPRRDGSAGGPNP
ncbi:MAG: gamma-glutamyltransferase [Phycisphaerae bacterium]|jgi:gamma-glutamyltranspeptidase/glutathione hydrolase